MFVIRDRAGEEIRSLLSTYVKERPVYVKLLNDHGVGIIQLSLNPDGSNIDRILESE